MDFKSKNYDYNEIKEMLCSKYEKFMRRNGRSNKESDSALNVINGGKATFRKKFEGRCYNCEKIRHKGVDCWDLDKIKIRDRLIGVLIPVNIIRMISGQINK